MTDWADAMVSAMPRAVEVFESDGPGDDRDRQPVLMDETVAQALRGVRAAERARCSIWLRLIIEYSSEHDISSASIDVLGGILAKIESGDAA